MSLRYTDRLFQQRWYLSQVCKYPCHGSWCAATHASEFSRQDYEVYFGERAWWQPRTRKQCDLSVHGPWCKLNEHPKGRMSPNPTRCFNSGTAETALEGTLQLVSLALTEEMEVLNSIYGPGTLRVLSSSTTKTRLRLELPIEEGMIFWLNFATEYPRALPRIQQAELTLQQERDRRIQNIFLILFQMLATFKTGTVCLFDLVDRSLPVIASLQDYTFDAEVARKLVPDVTPEQYRWTAKEFIDMTNATGLTECVICCDYYHAFTMIPAPCKHRFCTECFSAGWEVFREEGEPYTCCLRTIPLEQIRGAVAMSDEQEWRYKKLVQEKEIQNAFFCGNPSCRELIGDYSWRDLNRGKIKRTGVACQYCRSNTCVKCREVSHRGPCLPQDDAVKGLTSSGAIRRCPKCSYAWEKNGGCPHVICPSCKSHWWWNLDGRLAPFGLH